MVRKPDVQYIRFTTDGSAARAPEYVAPSPKTKLPKVRRAKVYVFKLDPLAFAGILMSLVMIVLMVVNCVRLQNVQQETDLMYEYVEELQKENIRLTATYQNGYDLEEVRQQALALGMIPKEDARRITVEAPPERPADTQKSDTGFLAGIFD